MFEVDVKNVMEWKGGMVRNGRGTQLGFGVLIEFDNYRNTVEI